MFVLIVGLYSGLSALGIMELFSMAHMPEMISGALAVAVPSLLAIGLCFWRWRG